jgi:CIC family chloride channel protein
MEDLWNAFKIPDYCKASVGGLVVGCIGLNFPQVMGLGYPSIEKILLGEQAWALLLVLLPLKILATAVTLGSGGSGGILSPSFFVGAALGGIFGFAVNAAFPEFAAPVGAYALVGMCAEVAGTTLAPLQALVMVLEMTKNYGMILPLALCCAISTFIAYRIKRQSIYTLKLFRRGIDIEASRRPKIGNVK